MDRISGEKDAPIAIAFRDQQVMTPGNDVANLEVAGKADKIADDRLRNPCPAAATNAGVNSLRSPCATMLEPAMSANW